MSDSTLHWTEDPGLLEQYVLGQVPEERLLQLNDHLKTCSQCREAAEKERDFVRSVRAYGREQLRSRLRQNLARTPRSTVPWPHVLSAAAIVLVVIGFGIYNHWWKEPVPAQPEETMAAGKPELGPAPPAADRGAVATDAAVAKPSVQQGARETAGGELAGAGAKKVERPEDVMKEDKVSAPAREPARQVAAEQLDTRKNVSSEQWVDGTLIEKSKTEKDLLMAVRPQAAAPAGAAGKGQETRMAVAPQYLLQQRPQAALPIEQQRAWSGIHTKVESSDGGLLLTAFTDQINLQNQTVQGTVVGPDSLVFVVDGIRIAYKLSELHAGQ